MAGHRPRPCAERRDRRAGQPPHPADRNGATGCLLRGGVGRGIRWDSGRDIIAGSFRQTRCLPPMLGRITATMRVLVFGTIPLGALLAGGLATALGTRNALWVILASYALSGGILLTPAILAQRNLPGTTAPDGGERQGAEGDCRCQSPGSSRARILPCSPRDSCMDRISPGMDRWVSCIDSSVTTIAPRAWPCSTSVRPCSSWSRSTMANRSAAVSPTGQRPAGPASMSHFR